MMRLETLYLRQLQTSDQGTISALIRRGELLCYITELPDRNNTRCLSRIPRGMRYLSRFMKRSSSGKYRNVWHITSVPGRSGVLMHSGNYGGDTTKGWKTHSLGCLLPALKVGTLNGQLAGLSSKTALTKIRRAIGNNDFYLQT